MSRQEVFLENSSLRVVIDSEHGAFDVIDKSTDTRWERDPWTGTAGELVLKSTSTNEVISCDLSKSEQITVSGGSHAQRASVRFEGLRSEIGVYIPEALINAQIWLDGDEADLVVQVDDVLDRHGEWQFVSLNYPCRLGSLRTLVDHGFLVLPFLQGSLLPVHHFPRQGSEFWNIDDEFHNSGANLNLPTYSNYGLWMPWAGVLKGETGFIVILESDDDSGVNVIANYDEQARFDREGRRSPYPRVAAVSPWWQSSKAALRYPRRARYRFFEHASHVTLAKAYRDYAKQIGLYRPLSEKIADKPHVERLVGASCVNLYGAYPHYTDYPTMNWDFNDVARIGRDMVSNLGLSKLYVNLWGGYTHLPPDSFPFDERKGDVAVLSQAIDEMQEAGLIFGLYHGYPPMLEKDAPWYDEALVHMEDGSISRGRWARTCSSQYVHFARKNMPRILEQVKPLADFPDIVTAVPLMECFNPEHPQSRTDDRTSKMALFDYLGSLGLAVGSENARAWAVPVTDYQRGGMYRYYQHPFYLFRLRVPLWQLVFHECGPIYRQDAEGYTRWDSGDYQTKCLEDLAFGTNPLFTLAFRDWEAWRLKVKEAQDLVGAFAGEVAHDEMTGHELLSEDENVFRTTFSSGARVTVNIGVGGFELKDGRSLPGYGYIVRHSDGQEESGHFQAQFERAGLIQHTQPNPAKGGIR